MSKVCEYLPDKCYTIPPNEEEEFCKCEPKYCKGEKLLKGNFSVATVVKIYYLNRLPQKDVEHFLPQVGRVVDDCTLRLVYHGKHDVPCNMDDVISVRSPGSVLRNVCYTLFSLIGKPTAEPEEVNSAGSIELDLEAHPEDYQIDIPDVSMQLSFHDPHSLSNAYVKGFRLLDATSNFFVLRKVVKELLPAPYETDCMDYIQKWKDRGGHGAVTEEDCIQECLFEAAMKVFDCVPVGFLYPNNERLCEAVVHVNQTMMDVAEECMENCKPACLDVQYEATAQGSRRGSVFCGGTTIKGILAGVRLSSMQTTTYRYAPKYEEIEAFSYVGGYVGMWLGISLVAVFDFFETVVMILRYPLASINPCKKRNQVTRVKRVHHY